MNFDQWRQAANLDEARFFSLGRHALAAGLRLYGVGAGDKVLLPEFVCRDLLGALAAVGAEAVWYSVGPDLRPALDPADWPAARAVLAVNYFGFSQPLEPFRSYAMRHGAALIEDNAHGFLSRDDSGRWLGTRGDIGIFSLRKTLMISDGAMLIVSPNLARRLPPQLGESGRGYSATTAWKAKIRRWPMAGRLSQVILTDLVRAVRGMRGAMTTSRSEDAESAPSTIPAPHLGLSQDLRILQVEQEVARRRGLYAAAETAARAIGVSPLFSALPDAVSPYGFAFLCRRDHAADQMGVWARSKALDLIRWPDLPHAVQDSAPDWYRHVCVINFL